MTRGASKRRRLRVRRGRKGPAKDIAEETGSEVLAEFGGCVIEAVAGASVVAGMLLLPAYLLLS